MYKFPGVLIYFAVMCGTGLEHRNLNSRDSALRSKDSHAHRGVVVTTLAHRARQRSFSVENEIDEISATGGHQRFVYWRSSILLSATSIVATVHWTARNRTRTAES